VQFFILRSALVFAVYSISISGSNEISLHVVDVSIGVHQELSFFAFDLNLTHYYVVDHVNRLSIFFVVNISLVLQLVVHKHATVLTLVELITRDLVGV
jgi:hypothetical protein